MPRSPRLFAHSTLFRFPAIFAQTEQTGRFFQFWAGQVSRELINNSLRPPRPAQLQPLTSRAVPGSALVTGDLRTSSKRGLGLVSGGPGASTLTVCSETWLLKTSLQSRVVWESVSRQFAGSGLRDNIFAQVKHFNFAANFLSPTHVVQIKFHLDPPTKVFGLCDGCPVSYFSEFEQYRVICERSLQATRQLMRMPTSHACQA
ncbi:hypothetical protein EGW08_013955 [Elysia chlorotica]|uniref:Uncharacterized protein n=1 Tax=Elysia chlorotica TaxID=188477 RepID=A0A433T9M9_ELYCH|nr:hypothetical protein EGW08_013955 [Elysia chlorotica]